MASKSCVCNPHSTGALVTNDKVCDPLTLETLVQIPLEVG